MLQSTLRTALILTLTSAAVTSASAQEARTVPVIQPGYADLTDGISLVGTLEADASASIVPRVTGYLTVVAVDVGDRVQRGDLLAVVDAPDLAAALIRSLASARAAEAEVASAEAGLEDARAAAAESEAAVIVAQARQTRALAALDQARSLEQVRSTELARTTRLVEQGAATREELETAQASQAAARAQLRAAQADIQIAEAETAAAQARVTASQSAIASAGVAVESARARVEAAQAAAMEAKTRTDFCRLECPFEGAVVTARRLHAGAHVAADASVVLELMDTRVLRMILPVPESDAGRLATGQAVSMVFRASGAAPRSGEVTRVSGALDRSTRTVRVEVDLDNADGALRPGMFCRATISLRNITDAITLPGGAVHTRKGADGEPETFAWVVRDGEAHRVSLVLGIDNGILVEIKQGLTGTEQVISGGTSGLTEGAAVVVAGPKGG